MKKIITSTFATLAVFSLYANEPNLSLLKSGLPSNIEITSIKPAPVNGFYEIQLNNDVIYLSEDGEKVISGDIFNLKEQFSYTDRAKNGLRAKALAEVKSEDKIIYKAKDEKYKVAVFTDISCPYCTKFHQHMADFNAKGVTVEYLAFPRAGAGSKPQKNMQNIWCAEDKTTALDEAKLNNKIPTQSCDGTQTIDQFTLGDEIGVRATPTVVFSDGEIQPGYLPPEQLLQVLEEKFN